MKRILVVQLRELGDVLLTTPLVRQLQRLYPAAAIDFACEPQCADLLRANPRLHKVWTLPRGRSQAFLRLAWQLRRTHYDLIVDGQGLPKTAVLTRLAGARRRCGYHRRFPRNRVCYTHAYRHNYAQPMYVALQKLLLLDDPRVDRSDLKLEFPVDDQAREQAAEFARRWLRPPVAAVYVASRFDSKRWPPEKFAPLIDRIAEQGWQPWLIYGPGQEATARAVSDQVRCTVVADYPLMNLPTLRGVMDHCGIFVGNDGGPRHIACAASLPTFTIFGLDHPHVWIPPDCPQHRFIAAGPASERSAQGHFVPVPSFTEIPVDVVWEDLRDWLRTVSP